MVVRNKATTFAPALREKPTGNLLFDLLLKRFTIYYLKGCQSRELKLGIKFKKVWWFRIKHYLCNPFDSGIFETNTLQKRLANRERFTDNITSLDNKKFTAMVNMLSVDL